MEHKRRHGQSVRKVGIFGGTFNPVHVGHLLMAQDAVEQINLDCVKFVPCAKPPHKPTGGVAPARHRVKMLNLAIRGNDRFEVDDLEVKRGGRSYSVDTVAELRQREPGTEWYFIIGSDSLLELHRWKDINRLARQCAFVVIARPGYALPKGLRASWRVFMVRGHLCEIASREIRTRVKKGQSIRYLVPEAIFNYIRREKLYL